MSVKKRIFIFRKIFKRLLLTTTIKKRVILVSCTIIYAQYYSMKYTDLCLATLLINLLQAKCFKWSLK